MISNLPEDALTESVLRQRFELICERVHIPFCLKVQLISALKMAYVIFPSAEAAAQVNEVNM